MSITTLKRATSMGDLTQDKWLIVAECVNSLWAWFLPETEVKAFQAAADNRAVVTVQGPITIAPNGYWLYAKLPKPAIPKPHRGPPVGAGIVRRSVMA